MWWIVTLRKAFDEEDSLYVVKGATMADAMDNADAQFRADNDMDPRDDDADEEDEDNLVFINYVVQVMGAAEPQVVKGVY